MQLEELSPQLGKEGWVRFYNYSRELHLLKNGKPSERSFDDYYSAGVKLFDRPGWREWGIVSNGKITGTFRAEPNNSMSGGKFLSVRGANLQPIADATAIKELLKECSLMHRTDVCRLISHHTFEKHLADALNGTFIDEEIYFEADVESLKKNTPANWLTGANLTGLIEKMFTEVPEQYWKQYIALIARGFDDIPFVRPDIMALIDIGQDRRNRIADEQYKCVALFNEADEPIALTEVTTEKGTTRAFQMMTGVDRNYRQRGLARYLKVRLLDWLLSAQPEVTHIETSCTITNTAMIKINRQMGFKEFYRQERFVVEL